MATIGRVDVEVNHDVRPFSRGLRQKLQAIVDRAANNLNAKIEAKVSLDRASLQRVKAQIERSAAAKIRAVVELDRASIERMKKQINRRPYRIFATVRLVPGIRQIIQRQLDALGPFIIDTITRTRQGPSRPGRGGGGGDNDALSRGIKFVKGDLLLGLLENIFKSGLKIRKVAVQMGAALTVALTAAGHAAGTLLASVATLIQGMGVLAGIGLIGLAFKLQMDGVPEVQAAVKRLKADFTKTFLDASKSLTPVFTHVMDGMGDAIQKQKGALTNFFDTVSKPLLHLGDAFNKLLGSKEVGEDIKALGDVTAKFLDGFAARLPSIYAGAKLIGSAFFEARDIIKDAFGPSVFSSFSADAISRGITEAARTLALLGDAVKAMKANMGQVLDGLGEGVTTLFTEIGDSGPAIFNALGTSLRSILPAVGELGASLVRVAAQVLPSVQASVTTFAVTFGAALGQSAEMIAPALSNMINLAAQLGTALSPLLPIFSQMLVTLEPIGTAIMSIFIALAPAVVAFGQLANIFLGALMPAIQPLLDAFQRLAENVGPKLTAAFTELQPAISTIGTFIGQLFAALGPVVDMFGFWLAGLIPVGVFIVKLAAFLIGLLGPAFVFLFGWVAKAIAFFFLFLNPLRLAWNALKFLGTGVSAAGSIFGGFVRVIQNVIAAIGRFIGRLVDAFTQGIARAGGFVSAVSGHINRAISFVASIPGRILRALGNMGGLLVSAGRAVIQGLINGITGMLGGLFSIIGNIASRIKNLKGPIEKDRKLLIPEGKAIIGGLTTGIVAAMPMLRKTIAGVSADIGVFSSGGNPAIAGGLGQRSVKSVNVTNNFSVSSPNGADSEALAEMLSARMARSVL